MIQIRFATTLTILLIDSILNLHSFQAQAHPVGTKRSNYLGLYDMHRHQEWCIDAPSSHDVPAVDTAGSTREDNKDRLIRGGCWSTNGETCTAVRRWDENQKLTDRTTGFCMATLVEMGNHAEENNVQNVVLQKTQSGQNNRKAGNVIDAKVTPTNPFLLPNVGTSLRFRQEVVDYQERFRNFKLLPGPGFNEDGLEKSPTLEMVHKDFSLMIIPRTVIYFEGNCIEFNERATLVGENRSKSDMVAYIINQASIPVRITKNPAPKVTLTSLKETLNIRPFKTAADIQTIRGKDLHFLSLLVTKLDFKNYNHATKNWQGEVQLQLINNAGAKRIALKDKERKEVVLGNEVITVECLNYEFSKGVINFRIETVPKQNTITATIGEYNSGKP